MDSSPPHPVGPGERLLAAIVFTDVVSFSARMQAEEVTTLGLLERDFATMRQICEKYSGSVLKTTGDGLLLYFTSAVNAVACAQKMQRTFAERSRLDPAAESLTHRVGIHLGDVFVNKEDVMGDGVNIAARLQAQAEPGGICISQTVYDVVKNKLELDVVKLEPRELKNISEPVPMYRVLLEPPKARPTRSRSPASPLLRPATARPLFTRTQKLAVFAALVLALGLVLGLLVRAYFKNQDDLAESRAAGAALGRLVQEKAGGADRTPPMVAESQDAAKDLDFAELVRRRADGKKETAADEAVARKRATELVALLPGWMKTALQHYNQDRPLLVHAPGGSSLKEIMVFANPDGRIAFAEGGAIRPRDWASLNPGEMEALLVSELLDSPTPPPPEIMQGADAYAYLHGRPEITTALHRGGN
jgi:class 3 adenylate cyclase